MNWYKMMHIDEKKEILTCKDCMWYDTNSQWSFMGKHMCIFHDLLCRPDDFCSWAEKEEESESDEQEAVNW